MFTKFDRDTAVKWITESPGISDREIAARAYGLMSVDLHVSRTCVELAKEGVIKRVRRSDGMLGNWLATTGDPGPNSS